MRRVLGASALAVVLSLLSAPPAQACGGFFCGRQPVDQQAERIVFAMNPDGTVTMIVQIGYTGAASDFSWVLPLGSVPDVSSLAVFPQRALVGLDAQTSPQFNLPWGGCQKDLNSTGGPPSAGGGSVTVYVRAEVGPYDVAVIESPDPIALIDWLRANGFRVTSPMEPYIALYTAQRMKFLALRLQPSADVSDIQPFQFTLPGDTPSIPLRMTALAAEPEMGIVVFVLGDMRYGPANWPDLTIDDADIVMRGEAWSWPVETNWTSLVARTVDEAGGQGWVTEFAGSSETYLSLVNNSTPADAEQAAALEALRTLLTGRPYLTRLYTRLSAEEMRSDPIFRRTAGPDVSNQRQLTRYDTASGMCWWDPLPVATNPCDFASCGTGGLCRVVSGVGGQPDQAGCACVPGATARTTFDPQGAAIVACQDMRMSFLNPGDRELPGATPIPDVCVGYGCGPGGACVAMNMTPTCRCAEGLVAIGSVLADGSRQTRCTTPLQAVPPDFYDGRLPDLPADMPGGRFVYTPPAPVPLTLGGGCSTAGGAGSTALAVLFVACALFAWPRSARRRRTD